MKMPRSRQLALIIIGILTLVVGLISIYVTFQATQEDVSPDDSSADTICPNITYYNNCIQFPAGCTYRVDKYHEFAANKIKDIPSKYGYPAHCFTTQNKETITRSGPAEFCPANAIGEYGCGQCVQFDVPGGNGVSAYTGECPTVGCNSECGNGVADCSTGLSCINGRCRNPQFPDSTTCTGTTALCGDGNVDAGEQCDDGNTNNNDGCDNTCKNELSIVASCEGPDPIVTITWNTSSTNSFIDIDTQSNITSPFWSKIVSNQTSTVAPTGFDLNPGSGSLTFTPGVTYYARFADNVSNTFSATQSFNVNDCSTPGTTSYSGQVLCRDTGDPDIFIQGAIVEATINGTTRTATTDTNGNYTFSNVTPSSTTATRVTLPQGNLPNGQPYGNLLGPDALYCDNAFNTGCTGQVSGNYCANSDTEYANCVLPAGNFDNFDFIYSNCEAAANECISLTEVGPDPIDAGASTVVYILQYRYLQETDPFAGIELRVGPSVTPVGRDYYNNSSALVGVSPIPNNPSYNPVTGVWTYIFTWQATEVGGADVLDGTYDVRVILPGGSEISSTSCQEDITVTNGTTEEPAFIIVKQAAEVCTTSGAAQINYTVTATNVGPVSGVIDFVEDTYDSDLRAYGIIPTNISPTFGVDNGSIIRWEGSVSDRTFAAGQSKSYTYSVTIPSYLLFRYAASGVSNNVELQYTTIDANNVSFSLNTPIICTIPVVPDTAIFGADNSLLMVGIFMIFAGLFVYKVGFGTKTLQVIINKGEDIATDMIMPFEQRAQKESKKRVTRKTKK